MRKLWVVVLCACLGLPVQAAQTIEQIEACMRANIPRSLQIKEFRITATDKTGGTRSLQGRLHARLEEGLIHAMMRVDAPSDMSGTAYLVRESKDGGEEEMHVYLPALQKVRRITGGMRDNSLFGTDLSYADIKQITYAFTGDSLRLEREETLENRPVWRLSMKPAPGAEGRFDKVEAWIDQKSCTVLKADFLHGGVVRKRFATEARFLAQSGPHWYFTEGRIEDLQNRTSTHLRIVGVLSDKDIADRLFNPRMFYLGG